MPEFSGETHVGAKLDHNEDAIGWLAGQQVWLVADGLGGHASGDVASRMVKETILRNVTPQAESLKPLIQQAHAALIQAAEANSDLVGMGSTVVVARIRGDHWQVAWCGDSRAYLWRERRLQRLTRDHSRLELLIQSGEMTPEEAHQNPLQNQLWQALGQWQPEPDEIELPLQAADWLLLCSDGLHDVLTDDDMAQIFAGCSSPGEVTQRLIAAALRRQAEDNVSVVVVRAAAPDALGDFGEATGVHAAPPVEAAKPDEPLSQPSRRRWHWALALFLLMALALWWWS